MNSSKSLRAAIAVAATAALLPVSAFTTGANGDRGIVQLLDERHANDPEARYFHLAEEYVVESGLVSGAGVLSADAELDGVPVAEFLDLAHLADIENSTLQQAHSKHAEGENFRQARDAIELIEPDKLSSAEWLGEFGQISIKGEATPEITEIIETSGTPIALIENLPYSRNEIHKAAQTFATSMPEGGSVEVYEADGNIVVRMPPGAPDLSTVRMNSFKDTAPDGVTVRFDDLPRKLDDSTNEDSNLRGGAVINGNGDGSCLASFVLKSTKHNATRVGTARHCIDSSTTSLFTLHAIDGGSTTTLTVQGLGSPTGMDLGLLSHGGWNRQATFYADWNIKRGVYGRSGLPSVGEQVCHFRRINGPQCSTVLLHYYASGSDSRTIRVVSSHNISAGGDSGGPWFYGTTAKGVHRGKYQYTDTAQLSDFTPAYLYQNMGYDILLRN